MGNRPRESGGVRYAGFRVLRGGEEPREHGARTVVEKQPTAVPEHTGSSVRRSFAALGRSSLWRSSALMVFRMAMRRSNYLDIVPKFHIDPARHSIVDNVLEDASKSKLGAHRRTNIEEPNFACSFSFCSIVVSSRKCKRKGNAADELAKESIKLLNGVPEPAENIFNHGIEHRTEWKFKDIAFTRDTVYAVLVDAFAIVYPADIVSDSTRVATTAHAPRTCYASHAGGPPRTYGPPIAPQLDDRVSVTLDFLASAGLGLPGTIPTLYNFIRFRRPAAFLWTYNRTCQFSPRSMCYRYTIRQSFVCRISSLCEETSGKCSVL